MLGSEASNRWSRRLPARSSRLASSAKHAHAWQTAVATLEASAPKVALLLEAAEEELLAFMALPGEHWTKLRSTNTPERLSKEIARRSDVAGICPNDQSLARQAVACSSSETTSGSWGPATSRRSRSPGTTPRSRNGPWMPILGARGMANPSTSRLLRLHPAPALLSSRHRSRPARGSLPRLYRRRRMTPPPRMETLV